MNLIYKTRTNLYFIGFKEIQAEKELKVRDYNGVIAIKHTDDFEFEYDKYQYFDGLSDPKLKVLLTDLLDKHDKSVMVFSEYSGSYYLHDIGSTDLALCALTNMCRRSGENGFVMVRVV